MRTLTALLVIAVLSGCSVTTSSIDTSSIHPARPAAIVCPSSGLKKVSENVYQTDAKGYANLRACLSDVVRYVEESNGVYTFFTTKKVGGKP